MVFGQEDQASQEACWLVMTPPSLKAKLDVLINLMSLVEKKNKQIIGGNLLILASCSTKLSVEVNKTGSRVETGST